MSRIIKAFVHTQAHNERIEEIGLDEYEIWVTSPPADGQANQDTIDVLAYHLGIPASTVRIKSGGKSRHKLIEII